MKKRKFYPDKQTPPDKLEELNRELRGREHDRFNSVFEKKGEATIKPTENAIRIVLLIGGAAVRFDVERGVDLMTRHAVGGKCIRPLGGNACVVFVHGILSDGEQAWMNGDGITWPQILASEVSLSDIGIYTFSYRSDVFSKNYSIGDVVDSIRVFLDLDDLWGTRQLIFVCHSMGGIAVRRFIVVNQAKFMQRGTELGLFLVASPSLGSKDANAIHILSRLVGNSQTEALRFTQSNTWLNDLDKEFLTLKESKNIWIEGKELIEDEPMIIKKWFSSTQVVEPFSAARYFGEPYKVPFSDHVSISKPIDHDAIQQKMLVRFISQFRNSASTGVRTVTDRSRIDALCALLVLSDRLDEGKLVDKGALAAFSEALIETRRYVARRRAGAERNLFAEQQLSTVWNDAGHAIYEHDPELAQLCLINSNGWIDEGVWDVPRVAGLPIKLNDMLQKMRDVSGQRVLDIVEGEFQVDTVTWRTRVMLPAFSAPPEITLFRGGASREPEIESVSADQFTVTISGTSQAGTWGWRARGTLLHSKSPKPQY